MKNWTPEDRQTALSMRADGKTYDHLALRAALLWDTGYSTFEIAKYAGVHESVIYNNLPRWRRNINDKA
jgi:transposase